MVLIKIFNRSSIPYKVRATSAYNIEHYPMGQVVLEPGKITTLTLKAVWKYPAKTTIGITVSNILVTPDEGLSTTLDIDLGKAI